MILQLNCKPHDGSNHDLDFFCVFPQFPKLNNSVTPSIYFTKLYARYEGTWKTLCKMELENMFILVQMVFKYIILFQSIHLM